MALVRNAVPLDAIARAETPSPSLTTMYPSSAPLKIRLSLSPTTVSPVIWSASHTPSARETPFAAVSDVLRLVRTASECAGHAVLYNNVSVIQNWALIAHSVTRRASFSHCKSGKAIFGV